MTRAYVVPDNAPIDTIIMCALHARHSFYTWDNNELTQSIRRVFRMVQEQRVNVLCKTSQLSKGVELLKAINAVNDAHVPIRVAPSVMQMVELLERAGIPILCADNYDGRAPSPREPYIYITSGGEIPLGLRSIEQRIDFSLHDDFNGMKQMIRTINPRQAVMVHCAPPHNVYEENIAQTILRDGECRTQFLFPDEGQAYMI